MSTIENMTVLADVPTAGLYVGWFFAVITGLCLLAALALGVFAVREARSSEPWSDAAGPGWAAIGCLVTGLIIGLLTLWAMWPLRYEYHHYVSKTGTVESVQKRLVGVGSENGASERYVIKFQGDPFPYGVDDTRAALLKPGERVGIKCKKEHQFFQDYRDDGWACRWGA